MTYFIIFFVISYFIFIFLVIKQKKELSEKGLLIKNYDERFREIIDVDNEKEKIKEEKLKLEEEIKNLQTTIQNTKIKTLDLLDYKQNLEKQISILEEDQSLQEFGVYKPKYYFENSEEYKKHIQEINKLQKDMIKEEKAAICTTEWSVGGSKAKGRKMTKENLKLMLRAFNGECDSAIARVKYNNVDTMENRINKSFEVINKLNETNSCYITKDYLDLKIQELELNYEMAQKIQDEKEEQKLIREQMREEERAQREYEKAKLDAEKEEKRFKDALEKAEEKLKDAHGAQLEKLNLQIEKLKSELEEAERNKERATSMAQLTKRGHVYVISNIGSFGENVYKIGMTRRLDPMDRVRELGDASVPFNFDVHAMIFSENAPELENQLHKEFYDNRINKINDKREFFRVTLEEIKKASEKFGAKVEFTMVAEAEQYRQTLAMEKEKLKEEKNKKIEKEKEFIANF